MPKRYTTLLKNLLRVNTYGQYLTLFSNICFDLYLPCLDQQVFQTQTTFNVQPKQGVCLNASTYGNTNKFANLMMKMKILFNNISEEGEGRSDTNFFPIKLMEKFSSYFFNEFFFC